MSKETLKQTAATMFASTAHQVLWANPKGEFFTSENIGSLSLKPGQKLEKFERPQGVPEDEKKVNTKIRIRADLKKEARERGLNLSQVMEEALKKIFNKKL